MFNRKAKSFVTIMIVVAVTVLLLRTAITGIMKSIIDANESSALSTLKLISAALENYAKDNRGSYPASLSELTKPQPPYLDKGYLAQAPIKGYQFGCHRLEAQGYSCFASPARCKITGRVAYTVTTGDILVSEECDRKE
ncbi:MAG: hypothetical protein A3G38_00720 [Omnitrophica WOR_2 bacterium RIFCSPLOWO2_12_FULL_51_8]|nr:MAG: hypothetical protein A3G38_00720 [Omnitrophica WOR_2 bacterium RIFCSPLOWO2_12_FULL_51_8]